MVNIYNQLTFKSGDYFTNLGEPHQSVERPSEQDGGRRNSTSDGNIRSCLRVSSLLVYSRYLKLASTYIVETNSLKLYILYKIYNQIIYKYIHYIYIKCIYLSIYIYHSFYFYGRALTNRNSTVDMQ